MDKVASCFYGKGRCLHGLSQAKVGKDSTEVKSRTDLRDLIGLVDIIGLINPMLV